MPVPSLRCVDFLSCDVCCNFFDEHVNQPVSLGCGHCLCKFCLSRSESSKCPFDKTPITYDIENLPVNYAILQLIGVAIPDKVINQEDNVGDITCVKEKEDFELARSIIEELALYLRPLSEDFINELERNGSGMADLKVSRAGKRAVLAQKCGGQMASTVNLRSSCCELSYQMQKMLLTLVNCQLVVPEGRLRALKAVQNLGERSVVELISIIVNHHQLSANFWAAVRTRGCQFLGPDMQASCLSLILMALHDGSALSRKVLVMFVVQQLEKEHPQASKTSVGHVVQLLYRASCFKVTKREHESSLMQLKEDVRTYESLRCKHDVQLVQIAMEAGLLISAYQWSSMLYGNSRKKLHMQSLLDKHHGARMFTEGVNELVYLLQHNGDGNNVSRLRPHLETLAKIDIADSHTSSLKGLTCVMGSLKIVIQALLDFSSRQHTQRQAELSDTHIAMGKMNPGGDADTVASHPIDMPIRLVTSHAGEQTRCVESSTVKLAAMPINCPQTACQTSMLSAPPTVTHPVPTFPPSSLFPSYQCPLTQDHSFGTLSVDSSHLYPYPDAAEWWRAACPDFRSSFHGCGRCGHVVRSLSPGMSMCHGGGEVRPLSMSQGQKFTPAVFYPHLPVISSPGALPCHMIPAEHSAFAHCNPATHSQPCAHYANGETAVSDMYPVAMALRPVAATNEAEAQAFQRSDIYTGLPYGEESVPESINAPHSVMGSWNGTLADVWQRQKYGSVSCQSDTGHHNLALATDIGNDGVYTDDEPLIFTSVASNNICCPSGVSYCLSVLNGDLLKNTSFGWHLAESKQPYFVQKARAWSSVLTSVAVGDDEVWVCFHTFWSVIHHWHQATNMSMADTSIPSDGCVMDVFSTIPDKCRMDEGNVVESKDGDVFIPFDPPLVSKFGPITRGCRTKMSDTTVERIRSCDVRSAKVVFGKCMCGGGV